MGSTVCTADMIGGNEMFIYHGCQLVILDAPGEIDVAEIDFRQPCLQCNPDSR